MNIFVIVLTMSPSDLTLYLGSILNWAVFPLASNNETWEINNGMIGNTNNQSFNWEQSVNLLNYAKIARTELVWIVSQRNINYINNENNCKILSKLDMGNPGIYLKKNSE